MPLSLQAKLLPSQQQLADTAAAYSRYRPLVQKTLTAGFVVYVLSTTYQSLFSRSSTSQLRSKNKGKATAEEDGKKSPRVAVRIPFRRNVSPEQGSYGGVYIGRCGLLPTSINDPAHRDSEYKIHRGAAVVRALEPADIPDGDIALCCCFGWKVCAHVPSALLEPTLTALDRIVASLVRAQPVAFLLNILKWLLVAIPATWTNSWLSYVQSKLALAYRTRLTEEIMTKYLGDEESNDKIFYKLGMSTLCCVPCRVLIGRFSSKS